MEAPRPGVREQHSTEVLSVVHCVLQIFQHTGPLPASEDGGGEQKPLLWKPQDRVSDDGTLLRSSRQSRTSRNKPQRMERNNVEGVLTLQLSHPNVVQTFKAATRPLQVDPFGCAC